MPYWKLYYHFIWGTKNRLPLIDSTLEPELYRAIAAKAQAGVLSFGERNLPSVVRYIHNQKQHHADGTFIAAMERMDEV